MIKRRKAIIAEAELDITSFMNLMIVLVPVLLLSLVFAQIRVLN
ncbi:biopolymer transporter ExbD, partial [Flavobacterium sp. LMO9]|nr:biopolymer transporter ExbD [Flavobacterium sp. LMO9]